MKRSIVGLILIVAIGLLASPLAADAQHSAKVRRIGRLSMGSGLGPNEEALQQGLRELGYVEGQNIVIEYRGAEGKLDRLLDLAAELVRLKVDAIVAGPGFPAAVAAKLATATVPIVIVAAGDPVGTGLVASLAHPGGNITGISDMGTELSAKRLELLKEAAPKLSRVAVLWNSTDHSMSLQYPEVQVAARILGVRLQPVSVRAPGDFDSAFALIGQGHPDALYIISDILTVVHRGRIAGFTAKNRLPTMYTTRTAVADGGLMSYGPNFRDMFRRAAYFVDRILKGAKPADLPVEQPTRFELVINMKTAKALGLTFPPSILIRADQVIQ